MADAKATKEATRLAEQAVKQNPQSASSKAYLNSLQRQGIAGQIRARQLLEQSAVPKQPKTKPLPQTVAAQARATQIRKKK